METKVTKIYRGKMETHDDADDCWTIWLGHYVLVEQLQEDMKKYGRFLTVRYYISDVEMTEEELLESYLKTLFGANEVYYRPRYSEITGYLWTDEELKVGGHYLLDELKGNVGKYLHMEVTFHHEY